MVEQTAQQKADASAAWLAANRPDLVSTPPTTAAQAAATNLAYQTNALPVVPQYAPGGGAKYTQAEIQDAANEAAKYASFNAPIDFAAYANVPLSQMPANVASRVQDYYAAHPSARAQEITSQYAAQHGIVENPYDPNSAAGIAWEVQRTTGGAGNLTTSLIRESESPVDKYGNVKASYTPYGALAVSGISTVPVRDLSSGMLSGSKLVVALPGGTVTTYVPYGEYAQEELLGTKLLLSKETGELGVYQQPYGRSIYNLVAGGGRNALQSGMFTIESPETPYVVSQEKAGTYILPSGKGLSRLGAEAYGGFVRSLSEENLLSPNEAVSRYYGAGTDINLANYVNQIAGGKAEAPGAKIPWSISEGSPAIQYMDKSGVIVGSAVTIPGDSGRLVGSKVVGGAPTYGTMEPSVAGLPQPFVSTSEPSKQTQIEKFQIAAAGGYSGGLIGATLFGPKSPEVIKGYVGSVVDFATGVATLGQWQPFAEKMQASTPYGKTYTYGEYTKAGESAGKTFRESTGGYTEAQLETYGRTLEAKDVKIGPWYDPLADVRERIVFGAGKVFATNPEKVATAVGGGGALVIGGSVVGGAAEAIGAGSGATALAARTALTGGKYVLPVVFTGAMGYSVTEGGTAPTSKTFVNIGEMLPEATGAAVGGGGAYLIKGSELPLGFRTTKEQPTTYVFAEDIPPGVQSVRDIRKAPLGDIGLVPKQFEVAPTDFSIKTGTEVMDIGYVLSGRKAGAYPAGVVEGLKQPAPLTRGIRLEYLEPGLPGVQGVLTGAPKAIRPMTPAEAAFGLKLSVEPIGTVVSKGLETRFGGGTGISSRTLEQIINPEIAPIVQRTTYGTSIESEITQRAAAARAVPAVRAAEAQRIVPSATTGTFEKPVSIGTKQFEETLFGITESEKRAPLGITSTAAKRIPKGMQIDLLREALGKRKTTVISGSEEPFRVATESEIREQIAPTRRPAKEFLIREEIAPRQRVATEEEIMQMIKPTQRPSSIVGAGKAISPVEVARQEQGTERVVTSAQAQIQKGSLELQQPQIKVYTQEQRGAKEALTGPMQQTEQAVAEQQQTPYVPASLSTLIMDTSQTPTPTTYQKQTPYVPPTFLGTPVSTTEEPPTTTKVPPLYIPPSYPGTPTYPPTTRTTPPTATLPPVGPPIIPWLPSTSGGGGGGGSKSPWRKTQREIFYIGPTSLGESVKQFYRTVGNKKIASATPSGKVSVTQYERKRKKK